MNRFRFLIAVLMTLGLTLGGCAGEGEATPPLFNAKDLSLQCPTGQVGWDFSTGGNDTSIREDDISRAVTVDSATLGTCDYKADFAAECDGKSQCTRLVKKPASPACSGGELRLRYHCGEEAARYDIVVANDASSSTVTLGCGEGITIFSAIYSSNGTTAATQANITNAVSAACTGKRRCSLPDPYEINSFQDPLPNVAKQTTVRYYCGNETKYREQLFESGARIDIQCLKLEATAPVFKDAMRIQSVECASTTGRCSDGVYKPLIADWDTRIRAGCDGKKSCTLEVPADTSQFRNDCPNLRVRYWCTGPEAPEQKVFISKQCQWGASRVEFHCAEPMKITDASGRDANRADAEASCNSKSVCTLPTWQYDGGTNHTASYTYTCGDNAFQTFSRTLPISQSPIPEDQRQIECPAATNALYGGIRPLRAVIGGSNAIVAVTNACFGRSACTVQKQSFADVVEFRCGVSNERKTAVSGSSSSSLLLLNCAPDVVVTSLRCQFADSPDFPAEYCPSFSTDSRAPAITTANACQKVNNGVCVIFKRKGVTFQVKYQCGQDAKELIYTGTGELNSPTLEQISLKCDVPDKPYVEKSCVPATCFNKSRRDQKLQCIPDTTKFVTDFYAAPILKEWLPGTDGGLASQWGGAEVKTLNEDVPYQVFGFAHYRADNGVQLPPSTTTTVWAYDEFAAKPDAGVTSANQTTFGFRCLIGESDIKDAEYPTGIAGYRKVVNGGRGGVIPPTCYRQEVADGRNAWSDAAKRVDLAESQFRAKYTRKQSYVVASLDAEGRQTVRKFNASVSVALNPVGFFYDNQKGWVDQLAFYLQSADLRFKLPVTFVESNDLEISAVEAKIRKSQLFVDVSQPNMLPQFDVDLSWTQRGDSPARNPFSPKSLLSANAVNPLNKRKLRATIELARVDSTLSNNWVAVAATQFPARGVGEGNAFSKTTRLSATFTPELRNRLLSVKGTGELQTSNGWMSTFSEDQTSFRVRVCLDFDDKMHALGDADSALDNQWVSATRDGVGYRLGFKKRCAETAPVLFQRELYTYPAYPVSVEERPGNAASTVSQGDRASSSDNDNGNQNVCTQTGTTRSCAGTTRSNMASGGQFPGSPFENQSASTEAQDETTKTTKLSTKMSLFGFQIFDLSKGGMKEAQSAGAWSVTIDLTPNLKKISDAIKGRRQVPGGVKIDAKDVKTKPKAKKGVLSNFEREGLAMVLSKAIPFTLGPFPFALELSFSVGFGFGVSLNVNGDRQTTTSMFEPKYPCLTTGTQRCMIASDSLKTFDEANEDCKLKGGQLAEIRTAADLAAVVDAASSVGSAGEPFWLGGQAAYRYADPRCDTSRDARCAGSSTTRYSWLTGNVPFAQQQRQEVALVDPSRFSGNHPFGTNLGALVPLVPNDSAVLFKKNTVKLTTALTSAPSRYMCSYNPASSYVEAGVGVEVKVEFSVGFGASLCTPSEEVGFCIGIGINLINAGLNVAVKNSSIMVFNNSKIPVSLLGSSTVEGTWEVAFLAGSLSAELRFLFFNTSWEIASYQGIFALEGELFPAIESPYRKAL